MSPDLSQRLAGWTQHNQLLRLHYLDREGQWSERDITPLSWTGKGLLWAWCHQRGALRHFHPERMLEVRPLEGQGSEQLLRVLMQAADGPVALVQADPAETILLWRDQDDLPVYARGPDLRAAIADALVLLDG